MITISDDNWKDILLILESYRADLLAAGPDNLQYVEYMDALILDIAMTTETTMESDYEIEFEMAWDNPVPDDELDD